MKSKMLRQRQLKKQVLLRKLQAVRQTGGEDMQAVQHLMNQKVNNLMNMAIQELV